MSNNLRLTGSRLETGLDNAIQYQLRMGYTNTDNAFYGIKSSILLATRLPAGAEYAMQFNNYSANNTADFNYIVNTGNNLYKTANLIKIEDINVNPRVTTNAHKANVVNLSTGTIDVNVINANVINAEVINVKFVSTSYVSTSEVYAGMVSTSDVRFKYGVAENLSTNLLGYGSAYGDVLAANTLNYINASGNSISTINLSTSGLAFKNARGATVVVTESMIAPMISTIYLDASRISSITANISSVFVEDLTVSNRLNFTGNASIHALNEYSGLLVQEASGANQIGLNISSGTNYVSEKLCFIINNGSNVFNGIEFLSTSAGTTITDFVTNLSSLNDKIVYGKATMSGHGVSTVMMSTGTASVGDLICLGGASFPSISTINLSTGLLAFNAAAGPSISTVNLQTTGFAFVNAAGASISTVNMSTGSLAFNAAAGPSISTVNLQTDGFAFVNAAGASISTLNLSTSGLAFRNAAGPLLNASSIVYNTAAGDNLNVNNISSGIAHIDILYGRNATLTNLFDVNSISTLNLSTGGMAFRSAVGPLLNASSIVYNTAAGDNLNVNNISSGIAHIDIYTGRNLSLTNLFDVNSISTLMISTGSMFGDHAYFNNLTCEAFVTLSDRRFKKNVTPLLDSLDKVIRLEPVYYDWNDRQNMRPGHQEIGFIAQSVEIVMPNIVSVQGEDSRRAVAYDRITALLTGAIQELSIKVNDLAARLDVVERR